MKKIKKIIVEPSQSPNIFRIGKKLYVLKEEKIEKGHVSKLVFEETTDKKYQKGLDDLVDKILKKSDLDMKTVLKQALLEVSTDDLKMIKAKLLKEKPKTKKGCLYLNIGGKEIPIFSKESAIRGG